MSTDAPTASGNQSDPRLDVFARLTEATRSVPAPQTGAALIELFVAVAAAITTASQEQGVIWQISPDGTRMRLVPSDRPWVPADGPVAHVLGARRPIEMGVTEQFAETLVSPPARARARSTTDEHLESSRPFGLFVPIRGGGRIAAVLGLIRPPGSDAFGRLDRILVDAATERLEAALAAQGLSDLLAAERQRGLTDADGVLLSRALLTRTGRIAGDTVFRYLFNGLGTEYISDGATTAIGYTPAEITADPALFDRIIHPDDRHIITDLISEPGLASRPLLVRFLRRNGQISWQLLRVATIVDGTGRVIGVEGFSTDVTEMKLAEAELAHQARSDALTGLSNRLNFREAAVRALARIVRHPGTLAVLFLDLDGFKLVNDTLGHAAGDEVLRQVADRLRNVIRREDLVARLGGDEFAVLLAEVRDIGEASATARRILDALERPVLVDGEVARISTGVGIAVTSNGNVEPDVLVKQADIALYQAKRVGRGRWQVFEGPSGSLTTTTTSSAGTVAKPAPILTEGSFRSAFANGEFRVHFLPQITASTGRLEAVEALLRWEHPDHGLLPASAFITELASSDVIHPLGDWVLREACRHVVDWRERFGLELPVWINVHQDQLVRAGFVESFVATVTSAGLRAEQVGIDVPETVFAGLDTQREFALATLQRAGFRIGVDEFGVGGASLRALRRMPLSQLKLDRRVVASLIAGTRVLGLDADLVPLAVQLGGSLGARVVAVGVDSTEVLERIRLSQCDAFQGHLSGTVMAPEAVAQLLGSSRPN